MAKLVIILDVPDMDAAELTPTVMEAGFAGANVFFASINHPYAVDARPIDDAQEAALKDLLR